MSSADLIHDWNREGGSSRRTPVALLDDTLRDGLQNAAARQPTAEEKLELLGLVAGLGVSAVNLGMPASSRNHFEEAARLVEHVARRRLPISVVVAGRTLESDVDAMLDLAERTGFGVEGHVFVGTSAIRWAAESWDLERVTTMTRRAIGKLARGGIAATFVSEDTTRSSPSALREVFSAALEAGAARLCLCDTVGHATPNAARRLVGFTRELIESLGHEAAIDWHGHNDRGLGLATALAAVEAGADRVHATALGVGERVGNVPLELLLLNLWLDGERSLEPRRLFEYCRRASEWLGVPIPASYPLAGENAFRTATGVHAAAIVKAKAQGDWLADRVYSAVPAGEFGREQEIRVGFMSGTANVRHFLVARGFPVDDSLIAAVLEHARASGRVLADEELREFVVARLRGRAH